MMRKRHKLISHYRRKLPRDKSRMQKIYTAGVRPAAGYGAMVLGMSDTELQSLQRVLLAGKNPAHRGASLTA
eukprot:9330289-Pyramimonas_sp.AAC.1